MALPHFQFQRQDFCCRRGPERSCLFSMYLEYPRHRRQGTFFCLNCCSILLHPAPILSHKQMVISDKSGMSSTENEFMVNVGLIKISKSSLATSQNDIDQVLVSEGFKYKLIVQVGTTSIISFYEKCSNFSPKMIAQEYESHKLTACLADCTLHRTAQ